MQKHAMNSLPESLAEARSIGHNLYFTGVPCRHGHTTYRYVADRRCAECTKLKVKKAATSGGGNARRWANKTPEQLARIYAKRKAYYAATKAVRQEEKRRSYAKCAQDPSHMQKRREYSVAYRAVNTRPAEVSNPEVKRRYRQTAGGRKKARANDAKRHAAKMQRTPAWLTADDLWLLEQAYDIAALRSKMLGIAFHVDHIIPLQGKYVSGLHVPTNVQVIPWYENVAKANKYLPA